MIRDLNSDSELKFEIWFCLALEGGLARGPEGSKHAVAGQKVQGCSPR